MSFEKRDVLSIYLQAQICFLYENLKIRKIKQNDKYLGKGTNNI